MATPKQIAANRQNAKKSTGPTTLAGRANSSCNALKHGLTAAKITIFDEDAEAFNALYTDMMKEMAPVGSLEEFYAERAAICMWRLLRVPRIESEMFQCERRDAIMDFAAYQKQEGNNQMVMWPLHESRIAAANSQEEAYKEGNRMAARGRSLLKKYNRNVHKDVGNSAAVFRRLSGGQDLIARLSRYEADLERMLFRALAALHQLQAQRYDTIVEAPATVERLADTSQAVGSPLGQDKDAVKSARMRL